MADVGNVVNYAKAAAYIGAAIVMAVGSAGPALAQGHITARACEGIGKYPQSSGPIRALALMGIGFVEASSVYCLLIAGALIYFGSGS